MNPCRWLLRAVVLPTAVLLATTGSAHADAQANPAPNQLYGHITSNRTLTVAAPGPNYEVIGDLTVDPGVTLTIESGVALKATANSDFLASGADPGRVEIIIAGNLVGAGSGGFSLGCTSPGLVGGWAGVTAMAGTNFELRSVEINCALTGLRVMAGAVVRLVGCAIGAAGNGVVVDPNGTCDVEGTTLGFVYNGLMFAIGSTGDVRKCSITGNGGGIGMALPFSPSEGDSLQPMPTTIRGFFFGVEALAPDLTFSRLLVIGCSYAVHNDQGFVTATYCTFVDNSNAIVGSSPAALYNSILYRGGGCGNAQANYVDAWNPGDVFGWGNIQRGDHVSSFNPYFVTGDLAYHLSPASFYTNFSVSGGEIGAYGPGPGSPVPVSGASLVSAEASDGVSRIRWYVTDPGRKASIIRRVDGGEWEPKAVLYADGTGYIDLEDRDVTPGTRYGYAVGTQAAGQIGIDGEVWLTVELPALSEGRLSIVPNPATDGWAVRFTSAVPVEGTVEVVDLAGRCVSTQGLGLISPGAHSAYVPAGSLAPGVYWIRLRQGADLLQARAVKTK